MTFVKWGFVVICFFFSLNSISSADKSIYLYDDTGRLTRVYKDSKKAQRRDISCMEHRFF